ncbi:MAG TPA: ATP-binding protein [Verrucomicrobiae bacterium]|jgi:PAS domain S-box-containing protein|nr:ATP-binding protein [Verrucomicrobiae bacterium]
MKRDKALKTRPAADPAKKRDLLRSTRELSALLAVAKTATQSLDTEQVLKDTLDKSLDILGFPAGYIRILDANERDLVVRAARGLSSSEFRSNVVPLDSSHQSIGKIVYETLAPYVSPDVRNDPKFRHGFMAREGLISAAFVPITSKNRSMGKNRFLGMMMVGSPRLHRFSEDEIDLLSAFGAQLGAALDNLNLYEEVKKGKAYIENLVESAGDAIVSTDLEHRVLSWNSGAEAIFGYRKAEVIGRSLAVLLPPGREEELDNIRSKVLGSGVIRNLEVARRKKDGTSIEVSVAVSPIEDPTGRVTGFLHLSKDITEKKRYEERLKELDTMKSDFVSSVSHELRTPLTAIKGSVDNMLDGLTGELNEKQIRYLGRIKSNTDRLARLINDLLDLSRIEAGRIELKPARLEVATLARDITETLRPIAAEKMIEFEITPAKGPVTAWADRDKITQVIMNLIGNALKFTPSLGRITVAIECNGDGWVQVSIADTGPGIPRSEAEKIFDKFYQVASADRHKARGTGLGLSISKSLVEMHGGKIWMESEVGRGSTFFFTLPALRAPAV